FRNYYQIAYKEYELEAQKRPGYTPMAPLVIDIQCDITSHIWHKGPPRMMEQLCISKSIGVQCPA
ncbi:hypothetical protein, partial [Pseudoalteromonas luteoviolacea]